MGMTISEVISKMRYELNKNNKMADAYVVAIDTMRKYQKIEQIIEDWTKTEELEWKIREVMDNGNDD